MKITVIEVEGKEKAIKSEGQKKYLQSSASDLKID